MFYNDWWRQILEHTSRNQLESWLAWRQKWMLGGSYMDRIPVDRFGKLSFSLSPYPGSVFRRRIQLSSKVMRKLAMSPLSRSTIACSIMVNLASRSKLWSGNRKCSLDVIGSFLHLTSDRWPLILLSSCVWVFPMYCRLQIVHSIKYTIFLLWQSHSWKILNILSVELLLKVVVSRSCLQHFFEMFSVQGLHRFCMQCFFFRTTLELLRYFDPKRFPRFVFLLNAIIGCCENTSDNIGSICSRFQCFSKML